nr:hypothetical protein [Rhodococcus erythropolis]
MRCSPKFREPDRLPLHGRSVTQVNALEVSEAHTAVGCYDLYRTEAAGRGAVHVERRERPAEDGELLVTWTADSTPVE